MARVCPNCGADRVERLPARGVIVLVRHYLCHACDRTFAPRAIGFRMMAILIGGLLTAGAVVTAGMVGLQIQGRQPLELGIAALIWAGTLALGLRLIHLAVTCRRPYRIRRGFPVTPVVVNTDKRR